MKTDDPGWSKRFYHAGIVFKDKMWILGGTYLKDHADVWSTSDGENWDLVIDSAAWGKRQMHQSLVFKDKMWILGGCNSTPGALGDVWYSTNGKDWICAVDSAGWSRYGHSAVVFDDKMWVIGGCNGKQDWNDSWYSDNGVDWQPLEDTALWAKRFIHTSVTFDNKIWLTGGNDELGNFYNDIWYTTKESKIKNNPVKTNSYCPFKINVLKNNPSIKTMVISYNQLQPEPITITVYSVKGNILLQSLIHTHSAGRSSTFIWNGTNFLKQQVSTGMYYIRFNTRSFQHIIPVFKSW